MRWAGIDEALDAMRRGGFVIVVDDEERENEGDLIIAADQVTPGKIAFMVRHTSGLVCLPMMQQRLDELDLPLMVAERRGDSQATAFTVSVDYVVGTTTGISAADRSATIRAMVDPTTKPSDLARPGHVFPLRYRNGGVLVRPGHTEAAVDLARLAGLYPAGVLCELVNDDGTVAQGRDLHVFAAEHDIPLITIRELVAHRWREEAILAREVETTIPTVHGEFAVYGYESTVDDREQIALVRGDVTGKEGVLTRVHSECLTGDTFGSLRCDCRDQLDDAMRQIAAAGEGVLVYTRGHEGRGIGLLGKLKAYRLQDQGRDTVQANVELGYSEDARHYGVAGQILKDLKVSSVRLMTNNPGKVTQLRELGIEVVERVPHVVEDFGSRREYLRAKAAKLGHVIEDDELAD